LIYSNLHNNPSRKLNMNKKKHHYIPKFILNNFSKNGKISLYNHSSKGAYRLSINDAFTENNLNTIFDNEESPDSNFIEDYYDKYYEHPTSLIVKKILNDFSQFQPNGNDFDSYDFVRLLRFVVVSTSRNPFAIKEIIQYMRCVAYSQIYIKYYLDYGTVNFPYYLNVNRNLAFSHLEYIDKNILLLKDLKLTIYYHNFENQFFLLPDKFVCIYDPNNVRFGDKNLKLFMPISDNILICFSREEREVTKATKLLNIDEVKEFNQYILRNFYRYIGCSSLEYLKNFVDNNQSYLQPLKEINLEKDVERMRHQIQSEILQKIVLKNIKANSIITHIDHKCRFRILTKEEFEIVSILSGSIAPLKTRPMEM